MSDVLQVLGLAFLGSVIALLGGIVFLYSKSWSRILEKYSIPFAAGVLLTVSLLGLLPEAEHSIGELAYILVLGAFLSAYLFEQFIFGLHHHDDGRKHRVDYASSIPLVLIGDTIHNFVDGIAIASSFFVSPGLGLITAISTFLHEVPHEIGDFGILLRAGWQKKKIIIVNFLSASTTVIGAVFVLIFSQNQALIGFFLSIAAGLFLYLGASDFLPHIHEVEDRPVKSVLAMFTGVIMMVIILTVIPHT